MTDTASSRTSATDHLSRRRVIQGAAWATPAILLATATPALATSGRSLSLSGMSITRDGKSSNNYELRLVVSLAGFSSGDMVTLTCSFSAGSKTVQVTENSSGWNLGPQGKGADGTFTFTATTSHDGSGQIIVTKVKLAVSDGDAFLGTPATVMIASEGASASTGGVFSPHK